MSEVRIAAEPRTEFGKGGARRTRRAGKVPAVLYGHGEPPRHLSLPARELSHALKDPNVLLRLDLDGRPQLALAKDVQRDPLKLSIDHVDLVVVRRGEKVTVDVPVVVTGEASTDTLPDLQSATLAVEAEATGIPTQFEVDVTGLAVGHAITAGDVSLPSGVTLAVDAGSVVVQGLAAPTAAQLEAEVAETEAELGAGAAGAAAETVVEEAGEAPGEPTGTGDVVPDTDSGEGGPAAGS